MSEQSESTRLTLAGVIRSAMESRLLELHTAMPARVERFDPTAGHCDVQPLLRRTTRDADGVLADVALPVITHVPISYPCGGGWRMTFPLAPGDLVLLVVAERSLDTWLADGGLATPDDSRRHDLADAIVIPGIRSFRPGPDPPVPGPPFPLPGSATDLVLGREDGSGELRLGPDGSILLSAGAAADQSMVRGDALSEYLTTRLSVQTALGPSGPAIAGLSPGVELSLLAKVK